MMILLISRRSFWLWFVVLFVLISFVRWGW